MGKFVCAGVYVCVVPTRDLESGLGLSSIIPSVRRLYRCVCACVYACVHVCTCVHARVSRAECRLGVSIVGVRVGGGVAPCDGRLNSVERKVQDARNLPDVSRMLFECSRLNTPMR